MFDQPLNQNAGHDFVQGLIVNWELAADGLSLAVERRDGVCFPNGDPMTADDFHGTSFERLKSSDKIDTNNSSHSVSNIAGHSRSFRDFAPLNPGYGRISGRLY